MKAVMVYGIVIVFLTVFSVQDMRSRQLSKIGILLFLALAVVWVMAEGREEIRWHLAGGMLGGFFVGFSYISRGKIGMGDGLVLLGLGLLCGMEHLLFLVCVGCLLVTVCTACVTVIRRKDQRKCSYPFMPYLLVGEVLLLMGKYF